MRQNLWRKGLVITISLILIGTVSTITAEEEPELWIHLSVPLPLCNYLSITVVNVGNVSVNLTNLNLSLNGLILLKKGEDIGWQGNRLIEPEGGVSNETGPFFGFGIHTIKGNVKITGYDAIEIKTFGVILGPFIIILGPFNFYFPEK